MANINISSTAIDDLADELKKAIDQDVLRSFFYFPRDEARLIKTWRTQRGTVMHRIDAGYEVLEWLEKNHSQFGKSDPLWWKFDGSINITDKMLVLLSLKFTVHGR